MLRPRKRPRVCVVVGREHVEHPHAVGSLGADLLELVVEQPLADQLVERLVEQQVERQEVGTCRPGSVLDEAEVPCPARRVALGLRRATSVGLVLLRLSGSELRQQPLQPIHRLNPDSLWGSTPMNTFAIQPPPSWASLGCRAGIATTS